MLYQQVFKIVNDNIFGLKHSGVDNVVYELGNLLNIHTDAFEDDIINILYSKLYKHFPNAEDFTHVMDENCTELFNDIASTISEKYSD